MIQALFDREKALNSVLYVTNRLERRDFHKIFKILYFADRHHIAEWGTPITGDTYIAMDAGPVPSRIYDMFKIVRGDSYIRDTENLASCFTIEGWMYVAPKQMPDLSKLSSSDLESLDWALDVYGNMTYDEIKEKSHDTAWRSTAKDFAISLEDIAREAGLDNDGVNYVLENCQIQKALN